MLDVKPVMVSDPQTMKKVPDYWASSLKACVSRLGFVAAFFLTVRVAQLMMDTGFLQSLLSYDKDAINPTAIGLIRSKYKVNPGAPPLFSRSLCAPVLMRQCRVPA
jgi:hypothetical protein